MMRKLGLLISMLLTSWAAAAEPPAFRLPETVRPLRYDLDLTLAPTDDAFAGRVSIDVELTAPSQTIWLQAEDLAIRQASVAISGGETLTATVTTQGRSWLGLSLPHPIGPAKARIDLHFSGKVRPGVQGIFRGRRGADTYLYTQFEAIFARQAFPCFDEPRWKTPFRVTLRVPRGQVAAANGPVEREHDEGRTHVIEFRETAPLPTYLVAFTVGPYEIVDGGAVGAMQTPLRFLVPRGRAADAAALVEISRWALVWMEEYTGVPYPYDKLDTAVSDRSMGMENAGLIIAGESSLLPPGKVVTAEQRSYIAGMMIHEIAHHWFGDLVTPAWWDDIWLNESFATWITDKASRELDREWYTPSDQIASMSWAMGADSSPTARRIRQPIAAEYDIDDAFDSVTYAKGGAVLAMIEQAIGPAVMRRGIQAHFKRHAHGLATTGDFVAAISEAAGRDVAPQFASFLDQPGVPVVSGELSCVAGKPRLALAQQRYLPLGQPASAQTWRIPVCVRTGKSGADPVTKCVVLEKPRDEVALDGACPDWLVLNAGHRGYYHSAYTAAQLATLARAGAALDDAEVLGALADLRVRANGGRLPVDEALRLAEPIAAAARDRMAATGALAALYVTATVYVSDADRPAFQALVRARFARQAHALGLEHREGESSDARDLRVQLASLVGVFAEDPELAAAAVPLARGWLADRGRLDRSLVRVVLKMAVRADGRDLFAALRAAAPGATLPDQWSMAQGLMAAATPALLSEALQFVSSNEISPGNRTVIFWMTPGPARKQLMGFLQHDLDRLWRGLPKDYETTPLYYGYAVCTAAERDFFRAHIAPRAGSVRDGTRKLEEVNGSIEQCLGVRSVQEAAVARFLHGA